MLWFNRKRVVHDHQCLTVKEISRKVKDKLEGHYDGSDQEVVSIHGMIDIQWLPPSEGVIKLNANASYN